MNKTRNLMYLLLSLGATLLMTASCSDNKVPDVNILFEQTGATDEGGILTIPSGKVLTIDKVYVDAANSTPSSTIFTCEYYWNHTWLGGSLAPDFKKEINLEGVPEGNYTITLYMQVGANGYSLSNAAVSIPVHVTAPEPGTGGDPDSGNSPGTGENPHSGQK